MVNKLCICWSEKLWYYRNARCYNKKTCRNVPCLVDPNRCLTSTGHGGTVQWQRDLNLNIRSGLMHDSNEIIWLDCAQSYSYSKYAVYKTSHTSIPQYNNYWSRVVQRLTVTSYNKTNGASSLWHSIFRLNKTRIIIAAIRSFSQLHSTALTCLFPSVSIGLHFYFSQRMLSKQKTQIFNKWKIVPFLASWLHSSYYFKCLLTINKTV
jgi:hypothetical protein